MLHHRLAVSQHVVHSLGYFKRATATSFPPPLLRAHRQHAYRATFRTPRSAQAYNCRTSSLAVRVALIPPAYTLTLRPPQPLPTLLAFALRDLNTWIARLDAQTWRRPLSRAAPPPPPPLPSWYRRGVFSPLTFIPRWATVWARGRLWTGLARA